MKTVFYDDIPKEMVLTPKDESGWFEWKLVKGSIPTEEYDKLEKQFAIKFPMNFINWHKSYYFLDGDCSIVRLPTSILTKPLESIRQNLDWYIPEMLIPLGLIPFADEGNDTGPLVFDTRNKSDLTDFPIRVYDHEYDGDLDGLSDIIFSSFQKMIECLTHLLNERNSGKLFEIIPGFFSIDSNGAGSTGKKYWLDWIEMDKANNQYFNK